MAHQARIVGSKEDLGPIPEDGLVFFGNTLTREFSDIDVTPEQLTKLQGNHHVEVKEAKAHGAKSAHAPAKAASSEAEAQA